MQDKITIIETIDEAYDLGWIYLGRVFEEEAYQNVGEIWCKGYKNEAKFVLLADGSFQYRTFLKYLKREEALKKLFDEEMRNQLFKLLKI